MTFFSKVYWLNIKLKNVIKGSRSKGGSKESKNLKYQAFVKENSDNKQEFQQSLRET